MDSVPSVEEIKEESPRPVLGAVQTAVVHKEDMAQTQEDFKDLAQMEEGMREDFLHQAQGVAATRAVHSEDLDRMGEHFREDFLHPILDAVAALLKEDLDQMGERSRPGLTQAEEGDFLHRVVAVARVVAVIQEDLAPTRVPLP